MHPALSSLAEKWRTQSGVKRELLIFVTALLIGLLIMPVVIWLIGRVSLGAYANGGPWALWLDFMRSLGKGLQPFWAVVAGPYFAIIALRLFGGLLRRTSR